jgi:hypothetical protein
MRALNRVLIIAVVVACSSNVWAQPSGQIDRRALVERHTIHYDQYAPEAPASVGNGEFAFTFDITGLQTFPSEAPGHTPLGTMAQWAWHRFPGGEEHRYEDTLTEYKVHGRTVTYSDQRDEFIRANPHRFNLAQIGLRLLHGDGTAAEVTDLVDSRQSVSLWSGTATSEFAFEGQPVKVTTVAHPTLDAVAVRVESPLLASGRVAVEARFCYPSGSWGPASDRWDQPERHTTELTTTDGNARVTRTLDETRYTVDIATNATAEQSASDSHTIALRGKETIEATFHFHKPAGNDTTPNFDTVRQASADHWQQFWSTGGAIDLSDSNDPRWRELERRIVISQYQTAIHCAGSVPPQETGLVCNSWHGKSHLEMHWWHAAHFPLWGRFDLLERSLPWYDDILPAARAIAERQGYRGVRWPKMTGPDGVSSPSEVGEFLIWQQPHPIYFAEQAYQHAPTRETLDRYRNVVFESAEFMADYAHWDEATQRYVLGPVLIPAQECYNGRSEPGVLNPTYEVAYWRWALAVAGEWRDRLGLDRNATWDDVAERIARPHIVDNQYAAIETPPFTRRRDHPSMLAALGVLPDVGLVDRQMMHATLDGVVADWSWPDTWGWDYPMMAMTAARLGRPHDAIDYLLLDTPKNNYLANGHCRQADRLPIYLPANGGLLAATALMAAGWDDASTNAAPGFPKDGTWTVRHEGLERMLGAPPIPRGETGVPNDAVVIFDGSTTDNLVMNDGSPCTWPIDDGTLLVPSRQRENRGVWTKYHFRDAEIHVEFMLPKGRGDHGNSGLYFYGMVELQIYNSHDHPGDHNLAMGSVYGIAPPLVDAGLPPEQWQTYEIKFVAPRRNDAGEVITPGTITARLNGQLVQDETPFTKPLSTWAPMTYRVPPYVRDMIAKLERSEGGPLYLQDHDAPVRFRNIWIRPLDDRAGVWEGDGGH